ncbi:hypothetical protein Ocin01_16901 [Orchesella cincta]|uniref:Uncharacterized protein n=1 Tax=Orchesella cincta TaxID=48709 RepID=A0A1D2MA14_ORCCI|nr:hypothetical protein Ocin01_16901 [Orchesella cincta]
MCQRVVTLLFLTLALLFVLRRVPLFYGFHSI